jgi:hypothetical protein
VTPLELEQQRRVFEARGWIRDGYVTRTKVDELIAVITKKRGERAALQLREDMRTQWKIKHEWLGARSAPGGTENH